MPLGFAGRARGVHDVERVLGVVRLGGVLVGLLVDQVVPPDVAALGPVDVLPGAPDDEHVLARRGSPSRASSTAGLSALGAPRR